VSDDLDVAPRARHERGSVVGHIRSTLLTGLILTLPLAVTLWLFAIVVLPVDGVLQPLFHRAFGRHIPGLGLAAVVLLLYGVGLFGRGVPGRMLFNFLEWLFLQIPVARSVYNATKELMGALNVDRDQRTFREVCMIEYPRPGVLAMGFVTRRVEVFNEEGRTQRTATVYVPNPPNPATGNFVLVPEDDVHLVDMSVEDGLKMVLSGGIVAPSTVRMRAPTPRAPSDL
jgi:uncharacterized membrane protein